ncbi:MAG: M36 family metallopeptidase [Acidobacteriota bacterium]
MNRPIPFPALCCALLALLVAGPALAAVSGPYLVATPSDADAYDIAVDYALQNAEALGLSASDLSELEVTDRYVDRRSGTTHLYLRQQLNGIPVHNAILNFNIDRDGRLVSVGNRFVADLNSRVSTITPSLSAAEAVDSLARHLGLQRSGSLAPTEVAGGPRAEAVFPGGALSQDDIPVGLVWDASGSSVRLAWSVVMRLADDTTWVDARVDAETGEMISRDNWYSEASYRVFPLPFEAPSDTGATHALVVDPQDANASPFGWHDTNGAAGAEFTDTRGNNVEASEDTDANNVPGFRPDGGAGLIFDFAFDDTLQPDGGTNQEAAIVNLFYWNNIIHDVMWYHGFDEPAGNFQTNTYGRGGIGGDPVQADAQDGSGTNNANFGTPPDGADPRMQMFVWTPSLVNELDITAPGSIADSYGLGGANFGPAFDTTGITGDIVLVDDGTGASTTDGCEAITNAGAVNGNIALIDRGNCSFVIKVNNAQTAGATAAVIINNQGDAIITLGGTDPAVTISSGMIFQTVGEAIKAELVVEGGGVTGTARNLGGNLPPNRDSDFDNGVIIHEYGHGISNRLTGGPSQSGCLQNTEQMGEGWSDWYALALTGEAGDTAELARGIATYLSYQPLTGSGIRRFPYSTDTGINPDTYATIGAAGTTVPHGVGSVWAAITWDLYWALVEKHGFDPNIFDGGAGNNLAISLITDGLKFQACSPEFEAGRDGILAADVANYNTSSICEIWTSFADRGLGENADAGSNADVTDGVEDFTIPAGACLANDIFEDAFEGGTTGSWATIKDDDADIAVNGTAAINGSFGMEITIDDDSKVWIEDDSPSGERRYRARFTFDPNSVTMDEGKRQKIFQLFSDVPSAFRQITGTMRFQGGIYKILFKVHQDDSSWIKTGFIDITDGPQTFEVDWVQSTHDGGNNGVLRLWINGTQVSELIGIDNDLQSADRARLGVISKPKPGAVGSMYFDDFVSVRNDEIGVVPAAQ